MDTAAVDYELPARAIAQTPVEPRDAARLLIDAGPGAGPRHGHVSDLPSLVRPGDVVVVNITRVLPARLLARRASGAQAEVLLLEPVGEGEHTNRWEALVRPSRKLPAGIRVEVGDGFHVLVGDDLGEGRRLVDLELPAGLDLLDALTRDGQMPLPPYITAALADPERYQTTYAVAPGSVAAPTA
ncbi:MAG: S-adenosylmethionine:tRNA ribosyltransferase-isomerase, partial [Acidimicrobiales bacterium]|nr:S-adenosylmethionine:tRNA ribosyltransferase-isomerase [Acidimicrobiales bacterium]